MHVPGPQCHPSPRDSTSSLCDLFCSQPWIHKCPCLFKSSSGCVASLSQIICQALPKKPRPSHTKSWPTMPARKRSSTMGHGPIKFFIFCKQGACSAPSSQTGAPFTFVLSILSAYAVYTCTPTLYCLLPFPAYILNIANIKSSHIGLPISSVISACFPKSTVLKCNM